MYTCFRSRMAQVLAAFLAHLDVALNLALSLRISSAGAIH